MLGVGDALRDALESKRAHDLRRGITHAGKQYARHQLLGIGLTGLQDDGGADEPD